MRIHKHTSVFYKHSVQGILWMLCASIILGIMSLTISRLVISMNIFQIFWISSLISTLIFGIFMLINNSTFKTQILGFYAIRALFASITMILWSYVLKLIPVTEAIAISYLTPLLNIVAAVLIINEKITIKIFSGAIVGFIGTIMVLQPGFSSMNYGYVIALLTTIIWMVNDVLAKVQLRKEAPITHCFYLYLFMTIFSLPFIHVNLQPMDLHKAFLLLFLGSAQALNLFCFLQAYYKTEMSKVAPYDFVRIITTTLLAYIFFDEIINLWSAIGVIVICIAIAFLIKSEMRLG